MSKQFTVITRSTDHSDHIAFLGNIDASAEQQLAGLPEKLQRQSVQINFSQAGRINSMGIALLLRCFKKIREEKRADIIVRDLTPTNALLFKMTGLFMLARHEK